MLEIVGFTRCVGLYTCIFCSLILIVQLVWFVEVMQLFKMFHLLANSCREEFDEEKEPDGMLLSGWTQAPQVEKDNDKPVGNTESTLVASQSLLPETLDDDIEIVPTGTRIIPTGTKRKLSQICSASTSGPSSSADSTRSNKTLEVDDDDVVVMLNDGNSEANKKKRL